MALRAIDRNTPIFMSPHKTLLNNVRSVAKLENLLKAHEGYLSEFGIHHVPDLLARMGVSLVKQFDILLGTRSLDHRHKKALERIFDRHSDKRQDLEQKLADANKELASVQRQLRLWAALAESGEKPSDEKLDNLLNQKTSIQDTITILTAKLDEIPKPEENGAIAQVFTHVQEEQLEQERFITHVGGKAYPYHLTPDGIKLIEVILTERDRVRGKLGRREAIKPDDPEMTWHEVSRHLPLKVGKIK